MRQALLTVLLFFAALPARAGFVEVGVSGNYRKVNLAENAYDEGLSLTGSVSYLFDEMSALELSYTQGHQERYIGSDVAPDSTTEVDFTMVGLDFILTLGTRDAVLRPYFKFGVARIIEKTFTTTIKEPSLFRKVDQEDPATVPSFGVGFRLALSKQLTLKVGADAWTSSSVSARNNQWDMAGRAGLSFMF